MDNPTQNQPETPAVDVYDISGKEPVLGSVAPEEIEPAITSGQFSFPKNVRVPVISPEGQIGDIDPTEAVDAFSQGYQYATPQRLDEATYGTPGQMAATAVETVANTALPGVAPAVETGLGISTPHDILKRQETNPGTVAMAQLGTLASGAGLFGELGAGEAALGSAVKSVIGESGLAKIATGAVTGVGGVAALQAADELNHMVLNDPHQTAQTAISGIGQAAVLGGIFGGGLGALGAAFSKSPAAKEAESILTKINGKMTPSGEAPGVPPIVKSSLSLISGIPETDMDSYILNHKAMQRVPDYEHVYNTALDHIEDIHGNFDAAHGTYQEAKSSYNDLMGKLTQDLKERGYDTKNALSIAQDAAKDATAELVNNLQNDALQMSGPVSNAMELLNKSAIEGSQASRALLDETPGTLSLEPMFKKAGELQDEIFARGDPDSALIANNIQSYLNSVETQYGREADFGSAKRVIQGLDSLSGWNAGNTSIQNNMRPVYRQLRYVLDSELKNAVPAYEKAIKPVADQFELLNNLDKYSTQEDAAKSIRNLKNPAKYMGEMPYLRDLEGRTGIKFTDALDKYASPNLRKAMTKALPEYAEAEKLTDILKSLKDPATVNSLEQMSRLSPEFKELQTAEMRLNVAENAKEEIRGLSPQNLQSKLNAAMKGENIAARELIASLPQLKGMDIPKTLELLRLQSVFDGSAEKKAFLRTLFKKAIGPIVGGMAGGLAGGAGGELIGAGIGAIASSALEGQSARMTKAILDHFMERYGDLPKALGASKEATKQALHGMLSEGTAPDAVAFKKTTNYIDAAVRGASAITKGAKAIFKAGTEVIPLHMVPDEKSREKLDERLKNLNVDQHKMLNISSGIEKYLPEHAAALAGTAMNSVVSANAARPRTDPALPLDGKMPLTQQQKSEWNRALDIAQQPLVVLEHLKEGTLLPKDIMTLKAIYPAYYTKMVKEVNSAMIHHLTEGEKIPYQLRQSLSLFLGQPMDSTFTPQAIQLAQSTFIQKAAAQQQAATQKPKPQNAQKVSDPYRTSEQAAEARRHSSKV